MDSQEQTNVSYLQSNMSTTTQIVGSQNNQWRQKGKLLTLIQSIPIVPNSQNFDNNTHKISLSKLKDLCKITKLNASSLDIIFGCNLSTFKANIRYQGRLTNQKLEQTESILIQNKEKDIEKVLSFNSRGVSKFSTIINTDQRLTQNQPTLRWKQAMRLKATSTLRIELYHTSNNSTLTLKASKNEQDIEKRDFFSDLFVGLTKKMTNKIVNKWE